MSVAPQYFCFRNHTILHDSWYNDKKQNEAEERLRIVQKAAAIISEDIRFRIYNTDYYHSPENFLNDAEEDVPETLKLFLGNVILKTKRKSRDKYKKSAHQSHTPLSQLQDQHHLLLHYKLA